MNESFPSLTASQQKRFQKILKTGIYKELHQRRLLTDTQLESLISRQR